MKQLVVGTTAIPLFIKIPQTREQRNKTTRPTRYMEIDHERILGRFKEVARLIEDGASYSSTCFIPTRAKGKRAIENPFREIRGGYKTLQVLVQPERHHYTFNGCIKPMRDCLAFYDMDSITPNRFQEAYELLLPLMEQKRAFVWKNAKGTPKAAFWMQNGLQDDEYRVFLGGIHEEVFGGESEFVPGLKVQDMFKCFIHDYAVLERMQAFFDQRGGIRGEKEKGLVDCSGTQSYVAEVVVGEKKEGLVDCSGTQSPFTLSTEFDQLWDEMKSEKIAHRLDAVLPEIEVSKGLLGRQKSLSQLVVLRFMALMAHRSLSPDGIDIPSTLIQKLLIQMYPSKYKMTLNNQNQLSCETGNNAIKMLVEKGLIEVVDSEDWQIGVKGRSYRPVHPEVISILVEQAAKTMPLACRTVEDVDAAWTRKTGSSLAQTCIEGCSYKTTFVLTNFCSTWEVFQAAALMIPGVRGRQDREGRLAFQWQAHLKSGMPSRATVALEEEMVPVMNVG